MDPLAQLGRSADFWLVCVCVLAIALSIEHARCALPPICILTHLQLLAFFSHNSSCLGGSVTPSSSSPFSPYLITGGVSPCCKASMVCHDFLFLPVFTEVLLIVDIGVAGHYKKDF